MRPRAARILLLERRFLATVNFRLLRLDWQAGRTGSLTGAGADVVSCFPLGDRRSSGMAYRSPRDLADSMARRRKAAAADDGYVRETFTQDREAARQTARAFLDRWPAAAYMSAVDRWRELPGDRIEFTMRRLKSAD